MQTTIAVSVTLKVNAYGHDVDALIENAVMKAMETAQYGVDFGVWGVSVEGATALVNREALDNSLKT